MNAQELFSHAQHIYQEADSQQKKKSLEEDFTFIKEVIEEAIQAHLAKSVDCFESDISAVTVAELKKAGFTVELATAEDGEDEYNRLKISGWA
jgi:hypothetical protein